MKKFKHFATLILLSVLFVTVAASCSDDDDEPAAAAAKEIAGTYNGDISCTVMGSESIFEDKTCVVTATSDTEVSITIDSFGEAPMALPSITVEGLKVTGADGIYAVEAAPFSGTTDAGKNYSGTIKLAYTNGVVVIDFQLQYGAMPMPLICSFTSQKQ